MITFRAALCTSMASRTMTASASNWGRNPSAVQICANVGKLRVELCTERCQMLDLLHILWRMCFCSVGYTVCRTHCNTLQHTWGQFPEVETAYYNVQRLGSGAGAPVASCTITASNTPQHAATHCNILQHTATYFNTLQHTTTYRNTMQRRVASRALLQQALRICAGTFVEAFYRKPFRRLLAFDVYIFDIYMYI